MSASYYSWDPLYRIFLFLAKTRIADESHYMWVREAVPVSRVSPMQIRWRNSAGWIWDFIRYSAALRTHLYTSSSAVLPSRWGYRYRVTRRNTREISIPRYAVHRPSYTRVPSCGYIPLSRWIVWSSQQILREIHSRKYHQQIRGAMHDEWASLSFRDLTSHRRSWGQAGANSGISSHTSSRPRRASSGVRRARQLYRRSPVIPWRRGVWYRSWKI